MADVALCTAAQVKAYSGVQGTDRDAVIAMLISVALRQFNLETGREFMQLAASATRQFDVTSPVVPLVGRDLREATTVTLDGRELTAGVDYKLRMDDDTSTAYAVLVADRSPGSTLEIEGIWGIYADVDAVPADLNKAAVDFVTENMGTALPEGYSPGEPQSGFRAAFPIPRSAWLALRPYNRELGVW